MQQPSIFVQGDSTVSLLYKGYASVILIYVHRLVPSWEDAEDIVLEVFLAALEQEKLLEENRSPSKCHAIFMEIPQLSLSTSMGKECQMCTWCLSLEIQS